MKKIPPENLVQRFRMVIHPEGRMDFDVLTWEQKIDQMERLKEDPESLCGLLGLKTSESIAELRQED